MAGNRLVIQPSTVGELSEAVACSNLIHTVGAAGDWAASLPSDDGLCTERLSGVIDFSPDDQVVSVRAGTSLAEVQMALGERRQCLPYQPFPFAPDSGIGGLASLNLPHQLEGECGTWRDWVLGMTLVLADGTVAKAGSHAVKNVAGYDVHKLAIGSRGSLFIVAEVILRTFPLRSLPDASSVMRGTLGQGPVWVQRVLASDFDQAVEGLGDTPHLAVRATSTLWASSAAPHERYPDDWVMRSGAGDANLILDEGPQTAAMRRTKAKLDPAGKLNPGAMGIF